MSRPPFDLRKFKHVKSDHASTTLQHKDGHILTIAHKKLSPEFQKQLAALKGGQNYQTPLQSDEMKHKHMASGGSVESGSPDMNMNEGGKVDSSFPNVRRLLAEITTEGMAGGGNVKEQKKKVFGTSSSPSKDEMREKHIEHIKNFAKQIFNMDVQPSGGKINPKTGERRDENPEQGVDKPDWRSGKLEAQWNPDAIVHELAHLALLPHGVGLKEGQKLMDKQYADVQKQYGYMKQKRSQGEIQPMAAEQILRRHMGLPAAKQSVPVKKGEGPRTAVDTGELAGTRVQQGNKTVDLIRQSRFLSPENRQKLEHIMSGHIKFHPEHGWQENPDAMGAKVRLYKEEHGPMGKKEHKADGGVVDTISNWYHSHAAAGDFGSGPQYTEVAERRKDPTNRGAQQEANTIQNKADTQEYKADGGRVGMAEGGETPYDAGLPCLNPNCKSHGKPHPNCRCYGGRMAKGGEVKNLRYCAHGMPHDPSCEYFAEGGDQGAKAGEALLNGEPEKTDFEKQGDDRNQHYVMFKNDVPESEDSRNRSIESEVEDAEKFINPQDQSEQAPPMADDQSQQQQPQQQPQQDRQQAQPQQPMQEQGPPQAQPGTGDLSSNPLQRFADHKQNLQNDYTTEDQAWAQDLANGHIKPETYQSLFAKKDTLGKIGTLFGLLLGGAGSGLTHTPNAVLQMMQQQINNDLDAQKTSKQNAINYLRLSQAHEMNKANINRLNAETAIAANTMTRAKMNRAALQSLVTKAQTYPVGSPARQAAEQQLAMLNQYVQNDNMNLADRAATAGAYYKMLGMDNNGQPSDNEVAFQNKQRALSSGALGPQGQAMAQYNIDRHIPNLPPNVSGQASYPIPQGIKDQVHAMNILDNKGKDLLGYIKQHTGTWNPQTRATAEQKLEELKNFYNGSIEGGALTRGRLAWYDEQFKKNPTDILPQLLGSTKRLEEVVRSNSTRRDQQLKDLGFTVKPSAQQSGGVQQGVSKSGRAIESRDGGKTWFYK